MWVIKQTTTGLYFHPYRNGYRLEEGTIGASTWTTKEAADSVIAKTTIENLISEQL
jgi:hypothetical protein